LSAASESHPLFLEVRSSTATQRPLVLEERLASVSNTFKCFHSFHHQKIILPYDNHWLDSIVDNVKTAL